MELVDFVIEFLDDYPLRRQAYYDGYKDECRSNEELSWKFLRDNFPEIIQNFFDRACKAQKINAVKAFFELDKTQLMEVPYIEQPKIDEI